MSSTQDGHTSIDWEDIYPKLLAYADILLKSQTWFRGKKSGVYLKGKEIDDYVMEAITKYLEHPEKYDLSQGQSLTNYLKKHILRTLIGNDATRSENKRTKVVKAQGNTDSSVEDDDVLEAIGPSVQAWFDDDIDYKAVMSHIQEHVKDDADVEKVFLGCCLDTMKRSEVIKEFEMTPSEYDNAIRRLNTIRRNAAKILGLHNIQV